MPLEPGQSLAQYRIERLIGKGGMGAVFLAEDTKLGRKVALKVLPTAMASDADRLTRFQREARAVAALNHPNIVTLYSVEESDGIHFITMELVEGQSLAELLPRRGFPLGKLLEIAIPLADAVSHAHRAGITHRDIKPDNIMIDGDGRLRVLDFGLAKVQGPSTTQGDTQAVTAAAPITEEGKILGTVAYMSPEQAEGKNVDPRSDVFSLGTTLYEMASGQRPFRGDTSMSTIGAILKDEPTPITEINTTLPRHVGRIIRRCLAKDPDRRYQTALELRNELEELKAEIDSGMHDAEASGIGSLRAATSRPKPAWWITLAGLGLLGVLDAGYFLWPRGAETPAGPASVHPLTSMAGIEGDPSWSPDGSFLVFDHFPGPASLFVVPTASGDPQPLVESDAGDFRPRWSPDSRWIAFVSDRDGRSGIFLVSPLGGQVQRLADINMLAPFLSRDPTGALGGIPWSPDARTLLFSRQATDGSMAIWEIELDSRRETQLTHPELGVQDLFASWSFDGSRIVFSRDENLWLIGSGGAPQPLLEDEPVKGRLPVWMPDGDRILFESDRSGNSDLWEIDTVSGSLRQITTSPGSLLTARKSPMFPCEPEIGRYGSSTAPPATRRDWRATRRQTNFPAGPPTASKSPSSRIETASRPSGSLTRTAAAGHDASQKKPSGSAQATCAGRPTVPPSALWPPVSAGRHCTSWISQLAA